jgi:hypothetical protein
MSQFKTKKPAFDGRSKGARRCFHVPPRDDRVAGKLAWSATRVMGGAATHALRKNGFESGGAAHALRFKRGLNLGMSRWQCKNYQGFDTAVLRGGGGVIFNMDARSQIGLFATLTSLVQVVRPKYVQILRDFSDKAKPRNP